MLRKNLRDPEEGQKSLREPAREGLKWSPLGVGRGRVEDELVWYSYGLEDCLGGGGALLGWRKVPAGSG